MAEAERNRGNGVVFFSGEVNGRFRGDPFGGIVIRREDDGSCGGDTETAKTERNRGNGVVLFSGQANGGFRGDPFGGIVIRREKNGNCGGETQEAAAEKTAKTDRNRGTDVLLLSGQANGTFRRDPFGGIVIRREENRNFGGATEEVAAEKMANAERNRGHGVVLYSGQANCGFLGDPFYEEEEEAEEVELSLGLSLNGRFGLDPRRGRKRALMRSASISSFGVGGEAEEEARGFKAPLARTCSLPATEMEAEEELRKRKELQWLRRREAKRKRMEKMKNGGVNGQPLSQGSTGSGSSGISDLESQHQAGVPKTAMVHTNSESRTPSGTQSRQEQNGQKPAAENAAKYVGEKDAKEVKQMLQNAMADMPYVSTRGYGPDGRKVDGFLYRYKKGEEVRIMCVCHGSFLTPAEFVQHAGGGDVTNPLKHIVVNPSPFLS